MASDRAGASARVCGAHRHSRQTQAVERVGFPPRGIGKHPIRSEAATPLPIPVQSGAARFRTTVWSSELEWGWAEPDKANEPAPDGAPSCDESVSPKEPGAALHDELASLDKAPPPRRADRRASNLSASACCAMMTNDPQWSDSTQKVLDSRGARGAYG